MKYSEKFINEIPKTDLHLHLDGSLRIRTLIELAKKQKVKLPSFTENGLKKIVFKKKYKNLSDYLKGFAYTTAVLQTTEALERVSYELGQDCIKENVYYIEVRFAPQLHINNKLSIKDVLIAVNNGLNKIKNEYNNMEKVKQGKSPSFNYGIIVCAMRMFTPEFSEYYKELFRVHEYSSKYTIFRIASMELAKAACAIRDEYKIPIVGFDLAGQENGYPAHYHKDAYEYCHQHFMMKTVHAGEAYGAESIFQAITELHANRIGHGYYLFDKRRISSENIRSKRKYIDELSNFIADRRITLEVCLTSNMQTNPILNDIKNHSINSMLKHGLSVTICTDNRLISNTSVTNELKLLLNNFDITPKRLKDIIIYGFKRSFYPASYVKKRKYCRQIIDYYKNIEKKYNML